MPRNLHFTIFLIISFALHGLLIAAILNWPDKHREQSIFPVDIVKLPPAEEKKLPPLKPPTPPVPPMVPESPPPEPMIPKKTIPKPEKFGDSDDVILPKTQPPSGSIEGAEQGAETEKKAQQPLPEKQTGPLPFLSQNDIDQLARKGMPEKKQGDDSVTLDTDEFKFISYNRWLKIRIESVLKYPELAAVSGYHGALYLKFDILKDGTLGGVEILKSSGYKILDDEALRAIRSSAPFQPLPDEWNMDRFSIRAAVIFYLGSGYIR